MFSIGKLIGSLLTLDAATAELSRPIVASFWVEVDLLKRLPSRVWMECGDAVFGSWQDIIYDISVCKLANPELAKMPDRKGKQTEARTKVFKKKESQAPNAQKEIPEVHKDPEVNKVPKVMAENPCSSQEVVKQSSPAVHHKAQELTMRQTMFKKPNMQSQNYKTIMKAILGQFSYSWWITLLSLM